MSFWLGRDFFNHPIVPSYILAKANKERIGSLNCTSKNISLNYNSLDEITFDSYLYNDGEKNPYYDEITIMKYILLPEIGFYAITSVEIESEGTEYEHKSVTAKSYEVLMGQKYLEVFTINYGTTESIDGVQFYDLSDKSKSLLHLVLEKIPDWDIGHIDTGLETMERSFQIDRQDVYSFLTKDVSEAFECVFLFDTLNNRINVYKESNICNDTNVYISYNNLLKTASISCSVEDIKTCLTLTGADDLNIREINLGYDRIFNLDYYHSTEYMSKSLYDAWGKWVAKRESKIDEYTTLLSRYQDYIIRINFLTHEKMPDDPESTKWSDYGLVPLEEKLATYEQKQTVMMKAGWGNKDDKNYTTQYLPVYNTITDIKSEIDKVNKELKQLKSEQSAIYKDMSVIIDALSMEANFSEEQLKELTTFIREEELSTENYVITSVMTDEERFAMLEDFLEYGERELAKKATPQLTFNADLLNLFAMEEFNSWHEDFNVGNYIHVSLRDNYLVKAKLLNITFDFLDYSNFSVTFGNVMRSGGKLIDITDAIAMAQSAATSVSFNASYWNEAAKDTSDIGKMLEDGLLSAGQYLKSGDDSEMIIDSRGIFVNTVTGEYANDDSIFIGGGRILFTDDNWETVAMAVGRATVKGESRFGVFADFVIAGYIAGSTIEGNQIIGGTIESVNYQAGKYGTFINLEKGTFEFNANKEQKLILDEEGVLTAKGIIKAESGWFGGENGFKIEAGKAYTNNKKTLDSTVDGVYLGTDGISLGANSPFKVASDGTLTAVKGNIGGWTITKKNIYNNIEFTYKKANNSTGMGTSDVVSNSAFWAGDGKFLVKTDGFIYAEYGTIGGATIRNDSIRASNDNWWVNSDGSASFKNVYISGVQYGSSFGSIGYNNGITWGSFGGSSYFGSNVDSPFEDTCVSHIQSISADYIYAKYLEAMEAQIGNLWAKTAQIDSLVATKASIESLDAAVARIGTLEATDVTIKGQLDAVSGRIGTLEADTANIRNLTVSSGGLNFYGGNFTWFMATNSTLGNYVSWV